MPARVGQHEVAGVAARVLVDRDQAGHAVALHELAPHQVAGALRRDHARRRPRAPGRSGRSGSRSRGRTAAGCRARSRPRSRSPRPRPASRRAAAPSPRRPRLAASAIDVDPQAVGLRLVHRRRVLAQADDHVHARVLQVQRVRVALGAVAENGHGLAVELARDRRPCRRSCGRRLSWPITLPRMATDPAADPPRGRLAGGRRLRGHPLRDRGRDREDHDRPARGAERVPPRDAHRDLGRARAGARGHRRRRDRPDRRGAARLLLGRRPERARRHRLHAERRAASAAST